ncbi:hypothetical protein J6590_037140 [Homalodisca vitripennis]|nr:hypothetical protein J6590_037140 [Homalodisca vitripennis]
MAPELSPAALRAQQPGDLRLYHPSLRIVSSHGTTPYAVPFQLLQEGLERLAVEDMRKVL